jgi:hypothetical protein
MGAMDLPLVALAALLPQLVALHLGALHPVERALTLVLAFGPFVLLGIVIAIRRRQDAAAEAGDRAPGTEGRQDPDR